MQPDVPAAGGLGEGDVAGGVRGELGAAEGRRELERLFSVDVDAHGHAHRQQHRCGHAGQHDEAATPPAGASLIGDRGDHCFLEVGRRLGPDGRVRESVLHALELGDLGRRQLGVIHRNHLPSQRRVTILPARRAGGPAGPPGDGARGRYGT